MTTKKPNRKDAQKGRSEVRRQDYEVTDESWIKTVLAQGGHGVLATSHEGQPYATPVNYFYDEDSHALYFHGARVGRTRANLALNPRVSFNVSQMERLVPGEKSSNFGVEYKSVTVFGTAELVKDSDEILQALLGLLKKYFPEHEPEKDYPLPAADEQTRTAVYRINIEEWSGKQQQEPAEAPGAFRFPPIEV
jgi:hypothetical protein